MQHGSFIRVSQQRTIAIDWINIITSTVTSSCITCNIKHLHPVYHCKSSYFCCLTLYASGPRHLPRDGHDRELRSKLIEPRLPSQRRWGDGFSRFRGETRGEDHRRTEGGGPSTRLVSRRNGALVRIANRRGMQQQKNASKITNYYLLRYVHLR